MMIVIPIWIDAAKAVKANNATALDRFIFDYIELEARQEYIRNMPR